MPKDSLFIIVEGENDNRREIADDIRKYLRIKNTTDKPEMNNTKIRFYYGNGEEV